MTKKYTRQRLTYLEGFNHKIKVAGRSWSKCTIATNKTRSEERSINELSSNQEDSLSRQRSKVPSHEIMVCEEDHIYSLVRQNDLEF